MNRTLLEVRWLGAWLCFSATVLLAVPAPIHAQTMVADPTYAPKFRYEATPTVLPQHDGSLAITHVSFLDDAPAPEIVRIAPDGTVLNDNGPKVSTLPYSMRLAQFPDGRRVEANVGYAGITFRTYATANQSALLATSFSVASVDGGGYYPPDPAVQLVALPDGRVIAAGNFEGGLLRINVDGTRDTTFAPAAEAAEGWFDGLAVLPDGSTVVGRRTLNSDGSFDPKGLLHHFFPDGAVDPTYSVALDDCRVHLGLPGGKILVGVTQLRRLNADGSPDTTFTAPNEGNFAPLRVFLLPEGTLLVAGTNAAGYTSTMLLAADGALIQDLAALFPGSNAVVLQGITSTGDAWVQHGVSYKTGITGTYLYDQDQINSSMTSRGAARVPLRSSDPQRFQPEPLHIQSTAGGAPSVEIAQLFSLTGYGRPAEDASGRFFVQGWFTHIDGHPHRFLARMLPDGTVDHSYAPEGMTWDSHIMVVHPDGSLLVGHSMTPWGWFGPYRRILPDGSIDPTLSPESDLGKADYLLIQTVDGSGNYFGVPYESGPSGLWTSELRGYRPDGSQFVSIDQPGGIVFLTFPGTTADGHAIVAGMGRDPSSPDNWKWREITILPSGQLGPDVPQQSPANSTVLTKYSAGPSGSLAPVRYSNELTPIPHWIHIRPDGTPNPRFSMTPADEALLKDTDTVRYHPDGGFLVRTADGALHRIRADGSRDSRYVLSLPAEDFPNFHTAPAGAVYSSYYGDPDSRVPETTLRRHVPTYAPGIVQQPAPAQIIAGSPLVLEAAAGDAGTVVYQWQRDGQDISGATSPRLYLRHAQSTDAGSYRCVITAGANTYVTSAVNVTVGANTAKVINFSARSRIEPGRVQIGGMVVDDPAGQPALVRAIGSALPWDLGVPLLQDPVLTLFHDESPMLADRGGLWEPAIQQLGNTLGAFEPRWPFPGNPGATPTNSALVLDLPHGIYTAHTTSGDGTAGVSLFEFYDADPAGPGRGVRNVSIRATTGPGADVLIPGFVIGGQGSLRILARAIGPSLAAHGVTGTATNPRMILRAHDRPGALDATNDDWAGDAQITAATTATGAFPLDAQSKDAALLMTLQPGAYTIQVPNDTGESGEVLVELYVLEP